MAEKLTDWQQKLLQGMQDRMDQIYFSNPFTWENRPIKLTEGTESPWLDVCGIVFGARLILQVGKEWLKSHLTQTEIEELTVYMFTQELTK